MSEKPDAPMSEEERADRLERMVDTLAGTIVDLKAENAALRDVRARASTAYNYWAGRDEDLGQRMAELREALEKSKVDAPYPGGT